MILHHQKYLRISSTFPYLLHYFITISVYLTLLRLWWFDPRLNLWVLVGATIRLDLALVCKVVKYPYKAFASFNVGKAFHIWLRIYFTLAMKKSGEAWNYIYYTTSDCLTWNLLLSYCIRCCLPSLSIYNCGSD